jgi:hypothetical protein
VGRFVGVIDVRWDVSGSKEDSEGTGDEELSLDNFECLVLIGRDGVPPFIMDCLPSLFLPKAPFGRPLEDPFP